ncbi:MAG: bacteriocin fulvocin C-related protein [Lacibacter sp.]|jgi:hypothetical protein
MRALLIVVALFATLYSCKKENKSQTSVDLKIIEEVLLISDQSSQKLAYDQILNAAEKYVLWQNRIDKIIAENELTQKQSTHLQLLKKSFTVEFFANKEARDKFMLQSGDQWINEALQIFGKSDLYNYFVGSISKVKYPKDQIASENEEVGDPSGGSSCNCHVGSSVACAWRPDDCRVYGCTTSTSGCGWWWAYSCNAKCWL